MNSDDQLREIFQQARKSPAPESSDFGFDTRLLAGIRAERKQAGLFGAWAWRLAPVFAAITIMAGVWNYTSPSKLADASDDASDLGINDHLIVDYLVAN